MIIFDISTVEEYWKTLSISDINEFYAMLKKLDNKSVYGGLEDEKNKLVSIKRFYANLVEELKKEKYEKIGFNVNYLEANLNTIFNICLLWNSVNMLLENVDDKDKLFNQYFDLNMIYSFKDTVFENATCLKLALEELISFYDRKEEVYETNYSLILLRVAHRAVLLLEANSEWFGNKKKEIADLFCRAAEKCYEIDDMEDSFAREVMDEIKVFVFKFCMYVQNSENTEDIENNETAN